MRVEVYKNLHTGTYSVRHKGRVIDHPTRLTLWNVTFAVQPAGREKVRREGRKNVHAFVRGELADPGLRFMEPPVRVSYNPYENDTFVDKATGAPVETAEAALLAPEGVFAVGVNL